MSLSFTLFSNPIDPQNAWVGLCKIGTDTDNNTVTESVDRLYLWKEWNTHTVVDASSTQDLTIPSSSSHNVRSLPPTIEPLVLLWISKNPTGGFPETHLAISYDERDLTHTSQGVQDCHKTLVTNEFSPSDYGRSLRRSVRRCIEEF